MKYTKAYLKFNNEEVTWIFHPKISEANRDGIFQPQVEIIKFEDFNLVIYDGMAFRMLEIKEKCGDKFHEAFLTFMRGQTCPYFPEYPEEMFVYTWDFENFLRPRSERFFD